MHYSYIQSCSVRGCLAEGNKNEDQCWLKKDFSSTLPSVFICTKRLEKYGGPVPIYCAAIRLTVHCAVNSSSNI